MLDLGADAVGDPADLAGAGLGRERALEVSDLGGRVHPAGAVHAGGIGREREDSGLA
ncbi:hypothetical protein D3C73_1674760 [compost metagenome]